MLQIRYILEYLETLFHISVSYTTNHFSVSAHPLCFSDDSSDETVTHLHFYAFVELLTGGRYGLSGAKLKVPELVLHSEEREGHKGHTCFFLQTH